MNSALKAGLLSGLVFPGFGHIALKHYKRGIVLILVAFAGLSVLLRETMQYMNDIVEKMAMQGGAVDFTGITNALGHAGAVRDSLVLNLASSLFVICWFIGVVDAYRIGKKKDKESTANDKTWKA